ncbi:phage tail assembly protein T [Escherichia coli]|nr:phage tail assembly protein T [Escherichia coli]EFL6451701.1 phage tail assembly protein T [Escherichia coli]EFM4219081.1 phage tail assembly protein T [Escherichia coli]EFN9801418.1 phage tail assembly protein T [Escherichia coli]EFP2224297.1 phage tail assembly protein T [Escherichia coli]
MGRPDWRAMLAGMSSTEYADWHRFYSTHYFHDVLLDMHFSGLTYTVLSLFFSDPEMHPLDFSLLNRREADEEPEDDVLMQKAAGLAGGVRFGPDGNEVIAPPDIPAGFVAVFNSDEASWHLVEDHRGKTVYDVASGDALFISELGPLAENVTWLSPEGEFQKWNGTAWVKDTEAEKLFRIREAEETKNSLMQVASEHIAPLQDAVDLEIATEEEISLLEAWKKYRVLLNRVNTTTAPDIEWPVAPIG